MGFQSFGTAEAWIERPPSGEMGPLKRHHSERMVWVPSGFLASNGGTSKEANRPRRGVWKGTQGVRL